MVVILSMQEYVWSEFDCCSQIQKKNKINEICNQLKK